MLFSTEMVMRQSEGEVKNLTELIQEEAFWVKLPFLPGEKVKDFTLLDTEGKEVSISDYKGKVTLLFFFATWCPYCSAEAPYLEKEVWSKVKDRGVQVLAVDVLENKELAEKMKKRFNWSFPVLLDDEGKVTALFAPEKEGLTPEVAVINAHFILDKEQRIRHYDYLNMERFDAHARATLRKLEEILEEQK